MFTFQIICLANNFWGMWNQEETQTKEKFILQNGNPNIDSHTLTHIHVKCVAWNEIFFMEEKID